MKTKNLFQMLLMAGMVCCLSLSMTSCSDDDDNDSTTTPGGGSAMDTDVTDDEMVLGSILENWCNFDSEKDMKHGIIDQTFEPVEGDVVGDNDLIRTIVVGTRQGADDYAVNVLGGLGISSSSPAGFSWSNPAIGTIKYNHSTGNEQGVIEVEIKQIPKLWKLRLVATPEVNAGESPYYSKGDIVLNADDNKYYICVSSHSYDQQSKWISFDCSDADRQTQKTSTAKWISTGSDLYYSGQQANYSSIVTWLSEFILSDTGYDGVINAFKNAGLNAEAIVNQVVPSSQELRTNLIKGITMDSQTAVLEAWERVGANDKEPRITRFGYEVLESKVNKWETRIYKPTGLLLAYMMRWNMSFNYWQPYVILVKNNDFNGFSMLANSVKSQTTLSPSHFSWKELASQTLGLSSSILLNSSLNGSYRVCVAAVHWTHNDFELQVGSRKLAIYGLLDFTKGNDSNLNKFDWMGHNITSHEISYKDRGKNSKFRSIRVKEHPEDKI